MGERSPFLSPSSACLEPEQGLRLTCTIGSQRAGRKAMAMSSSSSSAMASSLLLLRRCCSRLSLTSQPSLSPSTLAANPARNQPGGGTNLPLPFLLSSVRHYAKRAKKWQGGRCALHQVSLFMLFPFLLPSKLGFRICTLNPKPLILHCTASGSVHC